MHLDGTGAKARRGGSEPLAREAWHGGTPLPDGDRGGLCLLLAATLSLGYGLYAALLVIGAGAMGLFPCYYSLAQEVSPRHLGKATGLLAAIGWLVASPFQKIFGRLVDQTGSFDTGLALAGCAPAMALAILLACWPADKRLQPHGAE